MEAKILLTIAAALFCLGVYGMLSRRNAIGVLLSLELMANAVNVNLVTFARYGAGDTGQVFALFAIALTVTEVVVGLAIVVLLYRAHHDVTLDLASEMNG